jgi:polysaccharide export outer membrane protein
MQPPLILIFLSAFYLQAAQEAPGNLPARPISPNDLLSVTVYGSPELTRSVRVGADGLIRLPMLAHKMPAAGMLPQELEERLASALNADGILVDPSVTVAIAEYSTRPISVAGAVRHPLTYQIFERTTLLEALTRAEGVSPDAGGEILVTRPPKSPQAAPLIERVSLKGLIEQGDPALNLVLEGGEEVRVPQLGRVFVVGNVRHSGAFRLEDSTGLSVLKALALAEGLTPFSTKDAYIVRRTDTDANGPSTKEITTREITIALRKILDRHAPDVQLEANDILYIPDNRRGHTTASIVERAISFAAGTASGALVLGVNR